MSERELLDLISTAPRRYKVYQIPKRTPGKFRTIAHPARELKLVQRWLAKNVLTQLPVHSAATAYQPGTSILDNARAHVSQRYLLKLDIKEFFPSIKPDDLLKHCQRHFPNLTEKDQYVLTQILFRRNKEKKQLELSIGAPSSPLISNSVFYEIDEEISAYCSPNGILYTRYADDLSFSTDQPHLLAKVPDIVAKILRHAEYPKLKLNTEKTVHSSTKHRKQVTGLVLTPDRRVSVGREKKRTVKALIHRYLLGELTADQAMKLKGQLAFIQSVEPTFVESLKSKYGADSLQRLIGNTSN